MFGDFCGEATCEVLLVGSLGLQGTLYEVANLYELGFLQLLRLPKLLY